MSVISPEVAFHGISRFRNPEAARRNFVVTSFERVAGMRLSEAGSSSESVGMNLVFIWDRDSGTRLPRLFVDPAVGSELAYRFELLPKGMGIRRVVVDQRDIKKRFDVASRVTSRMLNLGEMDELGRLLTTPNWMPDLIEQHLAGLTALNSQEESDVERRMSAPLPEAQS